MVTFHSPKNSVFFLQFMLSDLSTYSETPWKTSSLVLLVMRIDYIVKSTINLRLWYYVVVRIFHVLHVLIVWPQLLNAALLFCFDSSVYIDTVSDNCYWLSVCLPLLLAVMFVCFGRSLYIGKVIDNWYRRSVRHLPTHSQVFLLSVHFTS